MYADAVVACNYLKDRLGHDRIVVFGYSMGTAPASAAARSVRIAYSALSL